jgi:hypothetical protein
MNALERRDLSMAAAKALADLGLTASGASRTIRKTILDATHGLRRALDAKGWQTVLENDADAVAAPNARSDGSTTFQVMRSNGRAPLLVLVTHVTDWMYPDTPVLWAHLRDAAVRHAHPVVLARKVAPITFPLLAALNARALQYYDLLIHDATDEFAIAEADRLGLPPLRAGSRLSDHSMFTHLLRLIEERPTEMWTPKLPVAFTDAIDRGFASATSTPLAIAEWAELHEDLPLRWTTGIRTWADQRERPSRAVKHRKKKLDNSQSTPVFGRDTKVSRIPFKI